jgi:hypothetical protein
MRRQVVLTACLIIISLVAPAAAQGIRSLTGSEWKLTPQREPEEGSVPMPAMVREAKTQEALILLRSTVKELTESLALANAEAETFKRQAADLALRLDTLGLAELDNNPAALEQKLLTAVRELRLQQQRNEDLEEQMLGLTEAVVALLQEVTEVPPESRMALETRLRRTNELLGALPNIEDAPAQESGLTNALVVEVKPELSLLIANVGATQGVKIGVPFRIERGNRIIGTALVVDVRQRFSGAIIQNLENETDPVQAGDRLRAITRF